MLMNFGMNIVESHTFWICFKPSDEIHGNFTFLC